MKLVKRPTPHLHLTCQPCFHWQKSTDEVLLLCICFWEKKIFKLGQKLFYPSQWIRGIERGFWRQFSFGIPRIPSDFLGFPRVSEETKKFRNSGVDLAKRRRHDEVNVEKTKKIRNEDEKDTMHVLCCKNFWT